MLPLEKLKKDINTYEKKLIMKLNTYELITESKERLSLDEKK
jgi:hypothetical protein